MSQKKMPEAERLFAMNITNYPTSFNTYDSMGDFEATNENKEKAVEYYKKALTINEYPETRKKLDALLKK